MIAAQLRRATFALVALAFGCSLAVAQDDPPVVDSEIIGSAPFRSKALAGLDLETQSLPNSTTPTASAVAPSTAVETAIGPVKTRAIASDPRPTPDESRALLTDGSRAPLDVLRMAATMQPWSGLSGPLAGAWFAARLTENCSSSPAPALANRCPVETNNVSEKPTCIPCVPAETSRHDVANIQPAPLSPTDSEMFASSMPRSTSGRGTGNWDSLSQLTSASPPRMPRMTKLFSFDTIDKVDSSPVAPALGQFSPELTLDLSGPESVSVNQVFQQLVQIRNSSSLPLHEIRVTQVCDLRVLGAKRHQAVTIDCLEPGETKTVRFSARARQAGTFALRYVAENSQIQADVDNLVRVSDATR